MAFESQGLKSEKIPHLGKLDSGQKVYDRPKSHLSYDQENYKELLTSTLSNIEADNRDFIVHTKKFPSLIGTTLCLKTGSDSNEQITYAIRKGRKGYSRFIRGKTPEASDEFTVILKKVEDDYLLISAFVGPQADREPWDPYADEGARNFWNTHALVWDPDGVDLRTITNTCPW